MNNVPLKMLVIFFTSVISLSLLVIVVALFRIPKVGNFDYGVRHAVPVSLNESNSIRIEFSDPIDRNVLDLVHIVHKDGSIEHLKESPNYTKELSVIFELPFKRSDNCFNDLAIFVIPSEVNVKNVRLINGCKKRLIDCFY